MELMRFPNGKDGDIPTVDGRNPAPPGIYTTLEIVG